MAVHLQPGFDDYFRAATPVDVIDRLDIVGQRQEDKTEDEVDLGARQWEFAWTQNRCLMPAWFGFASGIERGIERFGEAAVKDMFEQWPFARVLIADIELTLAKADLDIAERYSELAGDLHAEFYPRLRREFQRSIELVLRLTGHRELLETSDTLRRAIRLRNPYVDPMSYLQVDLLRRWRETEREDDDVLRALRASVNGIAHGMQNTG